MSKNNQFQCKVIIVTGAGTGMGADTAILLAERGAKVAIVGRREAPLHEVEKRIQAAGSEALVISADVSRPEDADRMVKETVEFFGALHGAVNNAGISSESYDLPELPYELWEETIAVNLSSIFYCMRAELPEIEKAGGGAIVNVSSVFADRGLPCVQPTVPASMESEALRGQPLWTGQREAFGSTSSSRVSSKLR